MISQLDKNISSIQYNFLNLPNQVMQTGGNTGYVYRADGLKVKKTYGTKVTDYLDGFQYENNTLQFVPTAEGYYDFANSRYTYNYVDHLGNVRISYYKNSTGVLTVLEESNYYPFGLKHEGYNSLAGNPSYQYKYNGKELQETGMYAMKWRQYMPDIGRWGSVDKLSELAPSLSTYRFAFDNPILFGDPTGLFETRKEAREYRREHNIDGSIKKNKDGSYSINDTTNHISYTKGTEGSGEKYANDGVQESVLLTAKKAESSDNNALSTFGTLNNYAGFGATGIEQIPGSFRITNGIYNGSQLSMKYYGSAWTGGSRAQITTYNIGKVGKGLGKATFVLGLAMDGYGVYEYSKNPSSPNAVHPGKATLNTVMGAYGFTGAGTIPATLYFSIDAFYPGGWEGAAETAAKTEANERAMTGHSFFSNSALKQ